MLEHSTITLMRAIKLKKIQRMLHQIFLQQQVVLTILVNVSFPKGHFDSEAFALILRVLMPA